MNVFGNRFNRRRFFQRTGAACAAAVVPASALGRTKVASPSERVTVAVVGLGSRGYNLIDQFAGQADAQIVAACDVDRWHYRDRPWGRGLAHGRAPGKERIEKAYARRPGRSGAAGVEVYGDYREVCRREDLDAVVVATPDHWHALIALEAMRAGQDVYCEKPLAHDFREGQLMVREAARRKAVFQTGSQQRSDARFRQAVRLVRNGHIGPVRHVEVGLPPGYAEPQGDATIEPPPDTLDYDFWCGPASKLPYMRARHHRWWRGHRAFGGGVLMDWIGHHNDIAHWALDMDAGGPLEVTAVGWNYPQTDVYNTPRDYEIRCRYAGGVTTSIASRHRNGTKWIGQDGWVFVTRGRLEASDARLASADFDPGAIDVYRSPGHVRNFLDCVKTRETCVAPAATALRSITPGYLGYVSDALQRTVKWDADSERIVDDEEANRMLHAITYREPWSLTTA